MELGVFGEDILVEILSRLPKKSLRRFKCVSRGWHSLLSRRAPTISPKATNAGIICGCPAPRLGGGYCFLFLRSHEDGSASQVPLLFFTMDGKNFKLADSCNGLLLFENTADLPAYDSGSPVEFTVYNPSTRDFVDVPLPPTIYRHTFLLGLASLHDGNCFQVIRVCRGPASPTLHLDVFNSQTGEWHEKELVVGIRLPFLDDFRLFIGYSCTSVLFKGALHWLFDKFLVIFHLEGEFVKLVELPPCVGRLHFPSYRIWESEGCLNYCKCEEGEIWIWVLCMEGWEYDQDENEFEWELKHRAMDSTKIPTSSSSSCSFQPKAFNDDLDIVYLQCDESLFSYKLDTQVLQELSLDPFCRCSFCYKFVYV